MESKTYYAEGPDIDHVDFESLQPTLAEVLELRENTDRVVTGQEKLFKITVEEIESAA